MHHVGKVADLEIGAAERAVDDERDVEFRQILDGARCGTTGRSPAKRRTALIAATI
jgi:hypothetical protein